MSAMQDGFRPDEFRPGLAARPATMNKVSYQTRFLLYY